MRVALVGRPAARARLRSQLAAAGIDVIAEFDGSAEARHADVQVDALVVVPDDVAPARPSHDRDIVDEPLTPREMQVLERLAEGLSNRTIAERLGISDQTVKFHVASILGKLRAANRTEAVRRGMQRGLLSL